MNHFTGDANPISLRRPSQTKTASDYGYAIYNEFPVSYAPARSGVYNIYLFGPIESSEQFISAIEVFNAAGEDDEVHVNLSTPGGSLDATDTFLSAMHMCKGRVIVHATGGVHSCGSIILLHANEFTLSENFNSLVHNGSTGGFDDLNKFKASSQHSIAKMEQILRKTYEGFLTPDELQAMIDGKDFWMDASEFMDRWYQRQDHFKTKMEQQNLIQVRLDEQSEVEVTPRPPRRRKKSD